MGYYAIKENKSLGETMSKAEIEESIENLSDSVDTKEQELRNYADDIPVMSFSISERIVFAASVVIWQPSAPNIFLSARFH